MTYEFQCDNDCCPEHKVVKDAESPVEDRNRPRVCLTCGKPLRRLLSATRPNESWSKWSKR